jgi:hypothetical protein
VAKINLCGEISASRGGMVSKKPPANQWRKYEESGEKQRKAKAAAMYQPGICGEMTGGSNK